MVDHPPVRGFSRLRKWQREAVTDWWSRFPADYLVAVTPGGGKTRFALALAGAMFEQGYLDRLIVVVPTDHLRRQWADEANEHDIALDPSLSNSVGPLSPDFRGYVTTYAQVATKPALHAARTKNRRTLVVLDEVHHAGDAQTWGEAVLEAFSPARWRLAMTGTPWRSSSQERIPFLRYVDVPDLPGAVECVPDFVYGYRRALRDRVVRPVVFAAYTGRSRWQNSAGTVLEASFSDRMNKQDESRAWRAALNPVGKYVPHVLAAADARLTELRAHGIPDAGGLVLASDQEAARAYADILARVTGQEPTLVLSDIPGSSAKIAAFSQDPSRRWLVAVRQVSEGVSVPRLAVCAYLTSYRTRLFFAQAIGRVIRARGNSEAATVFIPAIKPLLVLAAEIEAERNHVIAPPPAGTDMNLPEEPDDVEEEAADAEDGDGWQALDSDAQFAHVLASGTAHVAGNGRPLDQDDLDWLGLPGLLTPEQTAAVLSARDEELRRTVTAGRPVPEQDAATVEQRNRALRQQINRLVSQVAASTGQPHAHVHSRLRRAVPGPPSSSASLDVLSARAAKVAEWV